MRLEPVDPKRRLERDDGEVDRVRIEGREAPIGGIGVPLDRKGTFRCHESVAVEE